MERSFTYICVYASVCVFLYLLYTEYQNTHLTSKVRTILRNEDILADPHIFKGLFES